MPILQENAAVDHVNNVYVFIADSVRKRSTSEAITSTGISGRAIAASTYTASSFPSILSGQYPSTHCVWSFDGRLAERPELLSGGESFGMSAQSIWTHLPPTEKPPFRMVGAADEDVGTLEEMDPPFVAVEHHKGGHMPYGYSFEEYDTPEFYKDVRPSLDELPALYEESVCTAEERFLEALDYLKREGLLEETLVIYTSDHGESLGEAENGATVGHGDPISPDMVDVPIVFAGAGLPDEDLEVLLSGVDVAPTALSALGRKTRNLDGHDCWTDSPDQRLLRSERWVQYDAPLLGTVDRYRASSVWDAGGGMVFHRGSRLGRVGIAIGNEFAKAPWAYLNRDPRYPRRWLGLLRGYSSGTLHYGDPDFDEEKAVSAIEPFYESAVESGTVDQEQLRKLGYLE